MNSITLTLAICLLGQAEVPENPARFWERLTQTSHEVNVLRTEIRTIREKIKEFDGKILQINTLLLGIQNNKGAEINCPYQKYRNYIDIVLGILAVFGIVGLWNTFAGFFKKQPITIDPSFLKREE